MPTYLGSCLCKQVTFELTCEFKGFYLCHCSRCRKKSGSAHGANLFSTSTSFTWLSGQDGIKLFNVPGTRFETTFCTNCGSVLPTVKADGSVVTPAGSLDSEVKIRPYYHIFMGSKADWDYDFASVPTSDTFPK